MEYQVNEIFSTVQGEGHFIGVPATFIRLQGCAVGCPWCDSLRTWNKLHDSKDYWIGYVAGALIGDGWTDGKQRAQWQVTEKDFAKAIITGLSKGFDYDTTIKEHADWMRHKEGTGKVVYGIQCTKQTVVSQLLNNCTNVEQERGFVAGFFDAEGSLNNEYQIIMWQKNREPLELIKKFIKNQQAYGVQVHGPTKDDMCFLSLQKAEEFLDYYQPKIQRKWGKYAHRDYVTPTNGTRMEVDAIVDQVQFRHVVITGGEPTLWNLDELLTDLHRMNSFVQLETSGQNDFKGKYRPNWITWSPKRNLKFKGSEDILATCNEVKFVVDAEFTLNELWDCLESQLSIYPPITLMPEGCPPSAESMTKAMEFAQQLAPIMSCSVRMTDRLQYRLGVK